ncbi:MAG TPA: peptide-methionine (S)-S-oxide reductase [Verrucomicrobiae bacterium]|nr:peptide-methionine (S)-S-oxide reductase [Verrucomicrobiae bacterium]
MHRRLAIIAASATGLAVLGTGVVAAQRLASPPSPVNEPAHAQTVTFAGGCFWGLEGAFRLVPGVIDTVVGYVGVATPNSSSEPVGSRRADRLEACRVTFDPARVSYEKLVTYFFATHNAALGDGKIPYLGSPARLLVLFHNADEQRIAEAARGKLQPAQTSTHPPVVQILPEGSFERADESDQRYLEKHGLASCRLGS